jgi:hypothetical protein
LSQSAHADLILPTVIIIIFKLSQSPGSIGSESKECISLATHALELFETHLHVPNLPDESAESHSYLRHGLYSSRSIHEPIAEPYSLATWFDCLTLLWRTVMTSEYKSSSWDELTFKLLASYNIAGLKRTETQWIRKQAVSLQGAHQSTCLKLYNTQ